MLIPRFGATGAVIGSLFAESVIMIFYVNNCDNYVTFRIVIDVLYKRLLAAVCMVIGVYFINSTMEMDDMLILMIEIFSGALIYILVLMLLRDSVVRDLKKFILNFVKGIKD